MKAVVFLTLVASAWCLKVESEDEEWKERPIAKVVRLLNDMQKQLQKEAEQDEEAYEQMVCWCETNDKEKSKAVTLAGQRITQLESDIEAYSAKVTQLTTDIETLTEQVTELDQSLDKATEVRDKELAEFNAEEKDMIQSITSLKGAVVTLSKANSEVQTESLLQVRSLLQHHASKHRHLLARQGMVLNLLQEKTSHRTATPASGEIFGMLKQMKESFETNLAESKKEEEQGATEYSQLKEAKTKEIAAGKSQTETKEVELADAKDKGAQAAQDLKDTKAQLAADEEFLADMRPTCASADKEYEARVKARTAEIQAVSETIGILTSDEANDAFTKSMSFVQRTMKKTAVRREQASQLLREASKKFKSVQLLNLASSARLDAFGKVIEQISATVDALKQEQKDEVKDRDFCISELNANEKETAKYTDQHTALEQKIADLTASITDLSESIAALKQEVTDTQVGMKKAGEVRKAENTDFNVVVADQRATQAILKKALDRLKETYGFVQEEEGQPEQKTYAKSAGGGGALAMIEEIVQESKDLEQKALGDEQASQAAYEGYIKDSNKAITAATTDIANKADSKAKADQALAEADGDRKATVDTLLKLGEMGAQIHSQCDFLLKNFEARQSARTEEMDALNQAKQIFSSAR
jgi:chromosome segregation ATPase